MDGVRWRRPRRKLVARGSRYALAVRIMSSHRTLPGLFVRGFEKNYPSGLQMFIQDVEIIRSQFNMNPCSLLWRHADRSQRICAIVREQSNRAAFPASKYASRLSPISPHAWPISCPGCRESDILISKPSEASRRVSSQIRCRSIRLSPTKPVYAQRRIRGVRDQGDAAGRGWAVSVSNQESTRVARARRKRERVEQGVTHRDFALGLNVTMVFQLRLGYDDRTF
jgi:hypothetical protein